MNTKQFNIIKYSGLLITLLLTLILIFYYLKKPKSDTAAKIITVVFLTASTLTFYLLFVEILSEAKRSERISGTTVEKNISNQVNI